MPTLDWIGKQAVVNHHKDVPYRLLHCDSKLSVGDPDSGNLLVQGDNLEAMKAHGLLTGIFQCSKCSNYIFIQDLQNRPDLQEADALGSGAIRGDPQSR